MLRIWKNREFITLTGAWSLLVQWELMLCMLPSEINNSWSIVPLCSMGNRALPVVMRVEAAVACSLLVL